MPMVEERAENKTMQEPVNVWEWVAELAREHGFTQRKLSQEIGIISTNFSRGKAKKHGMRWNLFKRVARVLGYHPFDLYYKALQEGVEGIRIPQCVDLKDVLEYIEAVNG